MGYGSGYIYPRKNKDRQTIWYIAYPDSSKKSGYKREAAGFSKREAGRILASKMEIVRNFKYGFSETNALYREHFKKFLDLFHQGTETHKTYRGVLKSFAEFLSNKYPNIQYLHQFGTMLFDEYANYLRNTNHKCWTVKNHLKVLKTVFRKAEEWELIIKTPRINTAVRLLDAKPIVTLHNEKDFSKFFDVCTIVKPENYPIYFIASRTGLRFGELAYLEWGDIDLEKRKIVVRKHKGHNPKGRSKRTGEPKERIIPLTDDTIEVLRSIQRSSLYKNVFLKNGLPISPKDKSFRRWLVHIAKKAGIEGMTRMHELRHTYGQLLRDHGTPLDVIQDLLGHSDIRDTQRYAKTSDEQARIAVETLNGFGAKSGTKATQNTTQ